MPPTSDPISRIATIWMPIEPDAARSLVDDFLRKERSGKVLTEDDAQVTFQLGSRAYFRLMGMAGGCAKLPMLVTVRVSRDKDRSNVSLTMQENLGWYLFRSPGVRDFYQTTFEELVGGVRGALVRGPAQIQRPT